MKMIPEGPVKRFLMTAGLAMAVPMTALAHDGCGAMGGGGMGMAMSGEMNMHHLRGLNLSEAQRDKIFEIMHAEAPQMRERGKAIRKAHEELHAIGKSADYSDARAQALADTSAKVMAEMALAHVRMEHKIVELLTPEQRQQFADMQMHRGQPAGSGKRPMMQPPAARQPAR